MPSPSPRRSSRASYQRLPRDERRDQILGVARRMFTELPYADVSTAAIAREAGVQRGLIHYYFGTKRELFLEVVRALTVDYAGQAPPADSALPLEETVDRCVHLFLDAAESNADTWLAALDAEGFGQDPELRRIVNKTRDVTVERMLAVLHVPEPTDTLRAVLRTYSGLAEMATRQWLQEKTLSRAQVHTLLAGSLLVLVRDIAPAVEQT
ncbi:TetR/AcrR family transcriptional regulator [Actinomadura rudentiformis]|uniref:TetR/AcrR family transcriptional regulator n=1 Tax=Actinomadura rudentiformis TaxID=359158 RepID=A0A6H9YZH3_9ACTN|nr:TetR/AcrR family transcriptional regulator [Actinomadura rudentiformis]KAB2347423.1 TetR/AcrR family transcriptional regulator [Actinomadura rudentiformis]